VLNGRTGAGLQNLPVTITPSDGLPLERELESPVQAETSTNRRGELSFNGIAPGMYVMFIRFDANHAGYGEVVAGGGEDDPGGRRRRVRSTRRSRSSAPTARMRVAAPRTSRSREARSCSERPSTT
jgi:hypothetical protein